MVVERLAVRLFAGIDDTPLREEVVGWLQGSTRFRGFAEANADKIHKKLRGATADPETRRDVRAELRVAHLLLADRRIELAFEAYGSGRAGPDFTVTFRRSRAFNVEVTRLRRASPEGAGRGQFLAKLHQLPPSVPNALVIAIEGESATAVDVVAAVRDLRGRADRKDEAFFVNRGFDGTRSFYDRFLRLGAVLVWSEDAPAEARSTLWLNPSARIPLPDRAGSACLACLRAA